MQISRTWVRWNADGRKFTMSKRAIIVTSVAAVIIAATGAAYFRFWRAVPVTTVEAVQGRVALQVTGPGTIQARVPVTLSSRITATVARIDADVGDVVKRGQLLAVLDDRDLAARRAVAGGQQEILVRNLQAAQATVAKAQAELLLAQNKHRRDSDLQRAGFLSPAALDTSVAGLQSAQANLENARALLAAREAEKLSLGHEVRYSDTVLSFTRIMAPSDGVVIVRQTETGATVVPGSPIFRIADPATLWIAMRVDESVVGHVKVGQPAGIRLRTGETHAGKVARIARQSDAATRELEVNVAFDAPLERFAIDQEAEVTILAGENSGIVVPILALARDRNGRQGVLVVSDARTSFRPVETGSADAKQVIIGKGLAVGERLVIPTADIKAGMRVKPLDGAPR
jgi:HlyD family secretion protein